MKKLEHKNIFSNTYIITRYNKAFLIDPSFSYEEIKLFLEGYDLEGILLTHGHFDHTILIGTFNCPVYIHQDEIPLLNNPSQNGYESYDIKPLFNIKNLDLKPIKDDDKIKFADKEIKVIHTPGHTKGSVCFLFENHLFTGDTLFYESVGAHHFPTGNIYELRKSVVKLIQDHQSYIKIHPGHEKDSTIGHERKNNHYYLKWIYKQ